MSRHRPVRTNHDFDSGACGKVTQPMDQCGATLWDGHKQPTTDLMLASAVALETRPRNSTARLDLELRDVSALAGASELQTLDLQGCRQLSDLDFVKSMEHLRVLRLDGCTGINDISELATLPGLRLVTLYGSGVAKKSSCLWCANFDPQPDVERLTRCEPPCTIRRPRWSKANRERAEQLRQQLKNDNLDGLDVALDELKRRGLKWVQGVLGGCKYRTTYAWNQPSYPLELVLPRPVAFYSFCVLVADAPPGTEMGAFPKIRYLEVDNYGMVAPRLLDVFPRWCVCAIPHSSHWLGWSRCPTCAICGFPMFHSSQSVGIRGWNQSAFRG